MELILFTIFIFGTFVGSFLNVIVDRTNAKEAFLFGRSHCDYCKKQLKVIDLIPVLSFVLLNAKCRYCQKKLNIYYPITEILTGLIFTLSAIKAFNHVQISEFAISDVFLILLLFYISSVLIIIFFTDMKFGLIPFWAVASGIVVILLIHLFFPISENSLNNYFLSAIGVFMGFLLIFLITKGHGMGFGDVVYVLFMGLLLGFPLVILGLYIAFLSGALISLILVALKRKKLKGDSIPFGPFLILGTWIAFYWGDIVMEYILAYLLT